MKLCFSTLGCTERSLDDIFALCRRYGIDNLEIRGIGGELDNRAIPEFMPENISATRERFAREGVSPLVLGTSCAFHDPDEFACAVQEGLSALDTADALGAEGIRVFGNRLTDDKSACTARVIDGLGRLCAASRGASVLLEVHGDFNTVPALEPITEAFRDEPHFGLIWDIAHSHAPYGENWTEFYTAVAPFIRHVHIKDSYASGLCLPGDGDIPIKPIMKRLLADGYTGAFSLEWEKKWHPELPCVEEALERFVRIAEEL